MIKLFEEFIEFRKTDIFRFGDYECNKESFKQLGEDLEKFIIIGNWYRIRYGEYGVIKMAKSEVIRASNMIIHHGDIAITHDMEYKNGNIQKPSNLMMDNIHGAVWFSIHSCLYRSWGENDIENRWKDHYSKIVIEHLIRPDAIKNIKEDPYGEEDWND